MKTTRRRLIALTAAAALFLATAAASCQGNTHQSAPAAATDQSPGGVSQMPSGFRNVAYKCVEVGGTWFAVFSSSDGGNTTNGNVPSGIAAVVDPGCKTWGP
jgi:hypothetical protein